MPTSVDDEEVYVLSVGAIFGGPEKTPWREPVLALQPHVSSARGGIESSLNVNVVFQVPGSILAPDFEGVRTGSFSKKKALLMVQVALPREMPDDAPAYLRAAMVNAVDAAENWAARRHKDMDLIALHDLARRL